MEAGVFSLRELALMQHAIVIKRSPIHGLGVFARLDIPARHVVGYYKGNPFVGGDDVYAHCWRARNGHERLIEVEGPMKYMNHATEPNCDIRDEDRDPRGQLRSTIITICDVVKGEELTRYYSDYYESLLKRKR